MSGRFTWFLYPRVVSFVPPATSISPLSDWIEQFVKLFFNYYPLFTSVWRDPILLMRWQCQMAEWLTVSVVMSPWPVWHWLVTRSHDLPEDLQSLELSSLSCPVKVKDVLALIWLDLLLCGSPPVAGFTGHLMYCILLTLCIPSPAFSSFSRITPTVCTLD